MTESKQQNALKAKRASQRKSCRHAFGHGYSHASSELERVAAHIRKNDLAQDVYGTGQLLDDFQNEVAALLGKPAARYMPSGCMAQPIALRIWADRANNPKVAFHATSHLELHEDHAYRELHGLNAHLLGDPARPTIASDLEGLEPLSSLLIELPAREIGGQFPTWEQLVELSQSARSKQIRLHLDGARLWQAPAHYGKSLAEICALFDSIYVSFYKDIGALSGAMLIGPSDFIEEAATWQRRQGGTLYSNLAHIVSAQTRLAKQLVLMPSCHAHAQKLGAAWAQHNRVNLLPAIPQGSMFHLHIQGDAEALLLARDQVADEHGILLFGNLRQSDQLARTEISIGSAALKVSPEELSQAITRLFEIA